MYERFEELCDLKRVTPYRVCKETRIETATISAWKAGKYKPKREKLQKIADYFNVSINYILGETDNPCQMSISDYDSDFIDFQRKDGLIYVDSITLKRIVEKCKEIDDNGLDKIEEYIDGLIALGRNTKDNTGSKLYNSRSVTPPPRKRTFGFCRHRKRRYPYKPNRRTGVIVPFPVAQ